MLRSLTILPLLVLTTVGPAAAEPTPPTAKPAEVATVGTVPAVVSAADLAKLAGVERAVAARHAEAGAKRGRATGLAAYLAIPKAFEEVSTRIPSTGVRNREKPGQVMPPAAAAQPIVPAPMTTTAAPEKAGRP